MYKNALKRLGYRPTAAKVQKLYAKYVWQIVRGTTKAKMLPTSYRHTYTCYRNNMVAGYYSGVR